MRQKLDFGKQLGSHFPTALWLLKKHTAKLHEGKIESAICHTEYLNFSIK